MIIAFLGQQNGQGKTTLSVNVAMALAYLANERGPNKVLLIDADPQHSSLEWSIKRHFREPVHKSVDLPVLAYAADKDISTIAAGFDYTIIDGTPQDENLMNAVVAASDIIIIPLRPDENLHDLIASPTLDDIMREEETRQPFPIKVFYVLNKVKDDKSASEFVKHNISAPGIPVFNTRINDRVLFLMTLSNGTTVIENGLDRLVIKEINNLADEILDELNKKKPPRPIDEL